MRQYVIEYGMPLNSPQCLAPTETHRSNSENLLVPANHFNDAPSSLPAINGPNESRSNRDTETRPFPVMPVIIKEEPIDYEILSDITIETNTELLNGDDRSHCQSDLTPITNGIGNRGQSKTPINGSMVTLNDKSLLISTTNADVDYISAYLPTPSASEHSNGNSAPTPVQIMSREITISESNSSENPTGDVSQDVETMEVTPSGNGIDDPDEHKPNRISLNRQLEILRIDMHNEQMASMRFDERCSRTKGGVLAKKAYYVNKQRSVNPLNRRIRKEMLRKSAQGNGVSRKIRNRDSLRPRKHLNAGDKTKGRQQNRKITVERQSVPTAKPPVRKAIAS